AGSTHAHKVNFCKFTNETRNGLEDASAASNLKTICVINGTAAGGGYELALAADHIMLVDDGSSAVSLPELPLLAVLPGTGGPPRVPHQRKRRRLLGGVAARIAAAGRAAWHRRAHPRHRQAQGAARPCRRVLHHRGRHQGPARGRGGAGGRGGAHTQ